MDHDPEGRITLNATPGRVRIRAGETVIASTTDAIELRETGYPNVQYVPRADVAIERLRRSATVTHCPFKGDAAYYSIVLDGGATRDDAAWSYEQPFEAMRTIAGRLAFDTRAVTVEIEGESSSPAAG